MAKGKSVTSIEQSLFNELSQLIEQCQQQVFSYANSTLMVLFWRIGQRINDEILKNKRGEYAKQIVSTLSTQLKKLLKWRKFLLNKENQLKNLSQAR